MSGNKSLPNYDELAVEAICIGVRAYRADWRDKTPQALLKLSQYTAVHARRLRRLLFGELARSVSRVELRDINMGVAQALRAQANHLEMRAIELRDIAASLERQEAEWDLSIALKQMAG